MVRLIGTSPSSWEDAARAAVCDAAKTIRDLRVGRVTDLDVRASTGAPGGPVVFRAVVEVAFRIDRHRVSSTGALVDVRRYLIMGNATLASAELERAVRARTLLGPCEFHVLVPRNQAPLGSLVLSDPLTGFVSMAGDLPYDPIEVANEEAAERLAGFTALLDQWDATVTGEVGVANPIDAVEQVLARGVFDEIIVATLPRSVSRWLRLDLVSRLHRVTSVPVVHIETVG